ncbi:MAG: AAA domain-containing protein, partial [Bacteroidota bacterium]
WQQLQQEIDNLKAEFQYEGDVAPIVEELERALNLEESEKYQALWQAYGEKLMAVDVAGKAEESLVVMRERVPETIRQWEMQTEPIAFTQQDLEEEIFRKKVQSWLNEVVAPLTETEASLNALRETKRQIEGRISTLVAHKTWHNKQQSITDEQKSALSAWRNDLINIGKGHGKNTARNLQSAIENMKRAREVVPIWIMQQDTAIRFFPDPTPGQFDLLIVDEASQCDISMLNLIFRAQKSIIVGDENQTSVHTNASQFPLARTNQILDRYLIHHPFKQQFNINNRTASIYTLSGVIYPNIITLREHFRCRPEIINYSNKNMYNDQIVTLKTAMDDSFGKPVEAFYVEDDPTDKGKPKMVRQIMELIEGVIEDYESGALAEIPTIGILCLESSNEEHRDLIIRQWVKNPRIKAYEDDLQLLVGTSREFQGDERDVMILTTTASHGFTQDGSMRPPRAVLGEEMMRIYNVAASRARDKSILLHSIHPDAVAMMNPDCYRFRLLMHYSDPGLGGGRRSKLDTASAFQEEVMQWLGENGYGKSLHPHFQVGKYKLDLAVIHHGKKIGLAIDEDANSLNGNITDRLQQQMVLERAGWKVFRIQQAAWQFATENVQKRLSNWLSKHLGEVTE